MNFTSGGTSINIHSSKININKDYEIIKCHTSENSLIYVNKNSISEQNYYSNNAIEILLNGEIYNYEEIGILSTSEIKNSFFTLLENKYQNGTLQTITDKIDGIFNIIIIDKIKNEIFIITDRNGLKLLYFYFDSTDFIWSNSVTEIINLIKYKNELILKPTSVKMFMQFGYLLGNQTYFEKIHLTEPASFYNYKLNNNTLHTYHYWTWNKIKPLKIDFESAVDHASEYFNQAIKRRFSEKDKIGISLSGGLDSRFIVSAISKNKPEYRGFLHTFGLNYCLDIKIAKTIAKKLNWHHKLYFLNNVNLIDKRENMVLKTDGMFDMQHMHGLEFIDDIKKHININLNGYAGEVIMGGNFIKSAFFLNKAIDKDIAYHFYRDFYSHSAYNSQYIQTNHIDPYILINRGRRMANIPLQVTSDILIQRLPFMDNKLIDFIYSLPDEYRFNNKIYFNVLLKYHKELFEKIPWQHTELPIEKEYSMKYNIYKYYYKIISKIGIKKQSKNYIDYVKYLEELNIKPNNGVEYFFRQLTLTLYFKRIGISSIEL